MSSTSAIAITGGRSPRWRSGTWPTPPPRAQRTRGTHEGRSYRLTGPDLLTMSDVAAAIGAAAGRDVRFHHESEQEAVQSRSVYRARVWRVRAWVSTYQAIAAGELAPATGDVTALTGRPATALVDLLRDRIATGDRRHDS